MTEEQVLYSRPDYDIATTDPRWADPQMVKMIGTGKEVLELGCASGHFGKYLKTHAGCKVWAIEVDPRLAEFAKPHYEKIYIGDAQGGELYQKLDKKEYDVILCSNVLEHLPKPEKVLKNLVPLLTKSKLNSGEDGGFFVIALPNVAHFSVRLRLLFGNFDPDMSILSEEHLRYYTFKTARKLIEDAGLRVDAWSMDSDNGIPKFDGLLRRLPPVGPKFLHWFYRLWPTMFGAQFIFKASLRRGAK